MSIPPDPSEIENKARNIRALILDVDGVLTDGRITYSNEGEEIKTFHVRDGLGMQLFMAAGGRVVLLSGRKSEAVTRRGSELGIEKSMMFLGIEDKVSAFEAILSELGLQEVEVAYVGDDLPDLPLIKTAGLGFAPADAAPEVRSAADVVLRVGGGQGAVREVCERILKAKGSWTI